MSAAFNLGQRQTPTNRPSPLLHPGWDPEPDELFAEPSRDGLLQSGKHDRRMHLRKEGVQILRWALPSLALLGGYFIENGGLYFATRRYVRWMDELHKPADPASAAAASALQGGGVHSSRWLSSDIGFMSLVLESITDLLPVVCLGLIWRLGDIRLWCQTTFAAALLMTLKGFISWATIVPDTQGWQACKDRLGGDGLHYFRQDQTLLDMLADIILLEVRGIWFARPSRHRLCADAAFSGGTSLSVLFCTSLCEVSIMLSLRPSGRQSAEEADVLLPAIAQCIRYLLAALMVGNVMMPVLQGSQRAEAVALAAVTAVGVCNSPAVALAVDAWCRMWPAEDAAVAPGVADAVSPTSTAALVGFTRLPGEEDWEQSLADLGKVLIPPPWSVGQEYCYLRQSPLPEASAQKEGVMQQLLMILRQSQEQLARREQKKSELLKKEQADELLSAQRADRFAEQRIQEALSDQQRMLNSRARRKRTQTMDFRQSGPSADGLLLASAMSAMKPSRSEGYL